jgi:tRNA pseudouridine55 synthase
MNNNINNVNVEQKLNIINNSKNNTKSIIVIDKPHGISSMDVVRILRRILKPINIRKIGYAGTLDPFATGVLIVGIGRDGTRQLTEFTNQDKEYECEIDLLKFTKSGDMETFNDTIDQKVVPDDKSIPNIKQIQNIIDMKFIGNVQQIPPVLSAIKINGKPAYKLARQNIAVEMKSRWIKIYNIEIISYTFPVLALRVKCSKGTYIRTLAQDIGLALGFWGTLLSLRRISCGNHTLKDALDINSITMNTICQED